MFSRQSRCNETLISCDWQRVVAFARVGGQGHYAIGIAEHGPQAVRTRQSRQGTVYAAQRGCAGRLRGPSQCQGSNGCGDSPVRRATADDTNDDSKPSRAVAATVAGRRGRSGRAEAARGADTARIDPPTRGANAQQAYAAAAAPGRATRSAQRLRGGIALVPGPGDAFCAAYSRTM